MRLGTYADAGAIVGASLPTVKRWAALGTLPGVVRFSRKLVRVDLDVLEETIKARARGEAV